MQVEQPFQPHYLYSPWTRSERSADTESQYRNDEVICGPGLTTEHSSSAVLRLIQEHDPRPLFTTSFVADDESFVRAFPEVSTYPLNYPGANLSSCHYTHRDMSPTLGCLTSSYGSSDSSEPHDTPMSSPTVSQDVYSPVHSDLDGIAYSSGGLNSYANPSRECVAMHDIQKQAEEQMEKAEPEDDTLYLASPYGAFAAAEGYLPMRYKPDVAADHENVTQRPDCFPNRDEQTNEPDAPIYRRRRTHSNRPITSPTSPSHVSRRTLTGRHSLSINAGMKKEIGHSSPNSSRAFPCPLAIYGCPSSFGAKNEWKRHVNTQHMRLGFWRCDQCQDVDRKINDFNRKDLFTQHIRRMHPIQACTNSHKKVTVNAAKDNVEEQALAAASQRCYKPTRSPPESSRCLFCNADFNGVSSWDERMEHIGRHMESSKKTNEALTSTHDWQCDQTTETWMIHHGIIVRQGKRLTLAKT